jgi:hypothetical protein
LTQVISADLGALLGDHRLPMSHDFTDLMMTPQRALNPLACCLYFGLLPLPESWKK